MFNYLKSIYHEFMWRIHMFGYLSACMYILRSLIHRILFISIYNVYSLYTDGVNTATKNLGNVRIINKDNKKELLSCVGPLTKQRFEYYLNEDAVAFVVMEEGRLLHYSWVSLGKARLFPLSKGEAYLFDAFTAPCYRKQGMYTKALKKRIQYVRKEKRVFIALSIFNVKTKKNIIKNYRAKCVKSIFYVSFFGVVWKIPFDMSAKDKAANCACIRVG